jgi:hypothetical protein
MAAVLAGGFVLGCRSDTPDAGREAAGLKPLTYSRDPFYHRLDCGQPEPCVKLVLPRLVLADTHAVARRIDAWLFELMMAGLPLRKRDFNSRETYADSLFAHYQQLKGVKRARPWAVRVQWEVDRNDGVFFSGRLLQEAYLGGAHGLPSIRTFCVERRTGRNLPLDSILLPGKRSTFGREAQQKFVAKYEVRGRPPDFRAAGFWFENNRFRLPAHFVLKDGGLELIYNVYEVAPYSEGVLQIRFGEEELQPFLRPAYR